MKQQEADKLIEKYVNGTATPAEKQLVESWYRAAADKEASPEASEYEHLGSEMWDSIIDRTGITPPRKTQWWPRIAAAATVAIGLLAGGYFLTSRTEPVQQAVVVPKPAKQEILPGGNRAMLTLANGEKIDLNNAKQGKLAQYDDTRIDKTTEGQVVYNGGNANNAALAYNIITTPRGGQYSLVLTDGTKVALNAASSLKFPTAFAGKDRVVELTGEAYFEVAHNAAKPFKVISRGQTIEVLGTHFNINSYDDDELIKTTLLEGSVKVITANGKAILKPGQRSQVNFGSADIKVVAADMDEAVAWKNGLFEFNRASVKEVMRGVARWYDVNVSYADNVPDVKISGRISRKVNFSGLVDLLEFEGVKFSIDGKNVKILN